MGDAGRSSHPIERGGSGLSWARAPVAESPKGIAGTLQPQSGHIMLDGKILFDSRKGIVRPREQRPVGAVLQADCVNSAETVRDNLTAAFSNWIF